MKDQILEQLNWCGCGNPDDALEYLRQILQLFKDKDKYDEVCELIHLKDQPGLGYMILYYLDSIELTEHGGSVGGCWLSEKGETFLEDITSHQATQKNDFWDAVADCLKQFHGIKKPHAIKKVEELRTRLVKAMTAEEREIVFHDEPFSIACGIAKKELDIGKHRTEYNKILDKIKWVSK